MSEIKGLLNEILSSLKKVLDLKNDRSANYTYAELNKFKKRRLYRKGGHRLLPEFIESVELVAWYCLDHQRPDEARNACLILLQGAINEFAAIHKSTAECYQELFESRIEYLRSAASSGDWLLALERLKFEFIFLDMTQKKQVDPAYDNLCQLLGRLAEPSELQEAK